MRCKYGSEAYIGKLRYWSARPFANDTVAHVFHDSSELATRESNLSSRVDDDDSSDEGSRASASLSHVDSFGNRVRAGYVFHANSCDIAYLYIINAFYGVSLLAFDALVLCSCLF